MPIKTYNNSVSLIKNIVEPAYDNTQRTTSFVIAPIAQTLANATYTINNSFPQGSMGGFTSDNTALYGAYAPNASTVYRSTDTNNWTAYSTSGQYRGGITYLNGYFHNFGGSNDGGINWSTNGTTWNAADIGGQGAATTSYVVYNPARNEWIAGCGSWVSPQVVRKSVNGVSWTVATTFNSGVGGFQGDTIVATSGRDTPFAYLAVATTSSSSTVFKAAVSQEAVFWADTNLISVCGTQSPRFAFWKDGAYWYCNSNNVVAKSSGDGLTFTVQNKTALNLPATPTNAGAFTFGFNDVAFMSGTNETSFTDDGVTWYKKTHTHGTLYGFCSIGKSLYASNGADFFLIYTSP